MTRWNNLHILDIGKVLFAKLYKRKYLAHCNHEIHLMVRDMDAWLAEGVEAIIKGTYNPHHLQRYYFPDEVLDQLHISDRILQHILLMQLKRTFVHVMNKNCYHLCGPAGVRYATQRIRQVLRDDKPHYVIRADIKSYYKSIPHYKLIRDIKAHYDDPKVHAMMENIITNPIDTPNGCRNPDHGIALRGPLSQFFSALYLKPLDDAFDNMEVTYLRFQDDILIFCKSKRQMNRCRRRMMEILHERQLTLSRKKSRMGCISQGFHFLGVDYLPTRMADNTNVSRASDEAIALAKAVRSAVANKNEESIDHRTTEPIRIVPHARTLRKARMQVQFMVAHGFSTQKIRGYLHRYLLWWVRTSESWEYEELICWFVDACWEVEPAGFAAGLLLRHFSKSRTG